MGNVHDYNNFIRIRVLVSMVKVAAFPSTIHESVLEELEGKLELAEKAFATIAFFTLKKDGLSSRAWSRLKAGHICVDINYPTDLDAIDSLHREVNFYLYLKRTSDTAMKKEYKEPPASHYKRPRYKLHSKFILLDYAKHSEVIVGSHNWTGAALKGGNIEQGISITDKSDSPIIEEFRRILVQIKAECEKYDHSRLEVYRNLQIDATNFPGQISALEIHDPGRMIEDCPEFILASENRLPPMGLRSSIRLYFDVRQQSAIVEKLVGKRGKEAELVGVPVAMWKSGKRCVATNRKSKNITKSGRYDYYHITKLPDGTTGESRDRQQESAVTKEIFWRDMGLEEIYEDHLEKLSNYAGELGLELEEIFYVEADPPRVKHKRKYEKGPWNKVEE